MSLFDYFRSSAAIKPKTASTAKERLQIIVAHERNGSKSLDFLPEMKREILEVVKRYVCVEDEQVSVSLDQKNEDLSVLELNITLPESA
jgi:cell division topological specificity factor